MPRTRIACEDHLPLRVNLAGSTCRLAIVMGGSLGPVGGGGAGGFGSPLSPFAPRKLRCWAAAETLSAVAIADLAGTEAAGDFAAGDSVPADAFAFSAAAGLDASAP